MAAESYVPTTIVVGVPNGNLYARAIEVLDKELSIKPVFPKKRSFSAKPIRKGNGERDCLIKVKMARPELLFRAVARGKCQLIIIGEDDYLNLLRGKDDVSIRIVKRLTMFAKDPQPVDCLIAHKNHEVTRKIPFVATERPWLAREAMHEIGYDDCVIVKIQGTEEPWVDPDFDETDFLYAVKRKGTSIKNNNLVVIREHFRPDLLMVSPEGTNPLPLLRALANHSAS